ncbi:MAG: DUF4321 domain-containing protein [Alicyclobacillaceae bacterium]|nr:DUF4321 domain-containing protein [Alicyclobacillaceae bacterium]
MRKLSTIGRVILYCVAGLVIGNLAGDLLGQARVPYVAHTASLRWQPAADLHMLKYSLDVQIKLNMLGLVGGCVGLFLARRR